MTILLEAFMNGRLNYGGESRQENGRVEVRGAGEKESAVIKETTND
jgi:hypothetical protein